LQRRPRHAPARSDCYRNCNWCDTICACSACCDHVNPQCGCCQGHASYLRANGFAITVKETRDMSLIRRQHGVPDKPEGLPRLAYGWLCCGRSRAGCPRFASCSPRDPRLKGISLPGMPDGSPGMANRKSEPFKIYEISEGDLEGYLQLNTPCVACAAGATASAVSKLSTIIILSAWPSHSGMTFGTSSPS